MNDFIFKNAEITDAEEILKLYKSNISYHGCTWDEEYPNKTIITDDINQKELYCLKVNNKIVAVATLKNKCEFSQDSYFLTRVGVLNSEHRKGYSKILLDEIFSNHLNSENKKIFLLVNNDNYKAKKLYNTFNFEKIGEKEEYSLKWDIMIKKCKG
jgi:ribosomal protein S18 acetylase RimI-like enzyme